MFATGCHNRSSLASRSAAFAVVPQGSLSEAKVNQLGVLRQDGSVHTSNNVTESCARQSRSCVDEAPNIVSSFQRSVSTALRARYPRHKSAFEEAQRPSYLNCGS